MLLKILLFSIPLFYVCYEVSSRECSDCQDILSCQPALDLIREKRDNDTLQILIKAHCGYHGSIYKVCCSDLDKNASKMLSDSKIEKLKLLPELEVCGEIEFVSTRGGQMSYPGKFPWIALISYHTPNGLQFGCTGSIINNRYILTTARCVQEQNIAGVRLGEYDLRYNEDCIGEQQYIVCQSHIQDVAVEEVIIHEKYGKLRAYNDIALLRLGEDIDFRYSNVAPVCLPVTAVISDKSLSGERATVAGWGLTEYNSDVLLEEFVSIQTDEVCRSLYNRNGGEREFNKICAGGLTPAHISGNKGPCVGDSGGPLMLEAEVNGFEHFVQYGIALDGPIQCSSSFPRVYTDVRKYVDWILEKIEP
ncbi:phenoloxidase-activating factor 3-like [Colias croceus]|uniref:phenoloxidase-activating factor 3-like n=1 Tax=Colias crocea TaxID=72248 RepID=UPI001E27F588|nr:phenoloxidase-activating factor 3-like [Colias croceus]